MFTFNYVLFCVISPNSVASGAHCLRSGWSCRDKKSSRALSHLLMSLMSFFVIIWLKAHFGARSDSVHAFGYNSTESEPIWIKSGALWVYLSGTGPSRFCRDESFRNRIYKFPRKGRFYKNAKMLFLHKMLFLPSLATPGRHKFTTQRWLQIDGYSLPN